MLPSPWDRSSELLQGGRQGGCAAGEHAVQDDRVLGDVHLNLPDRHEGRVVALAPTLYGGVERLGPPDVHCHHSTRRNINLLTLETYS